MDNVRPVALLSGKAAAALFQAVARVGRSAAIRADGEAMLFSLKSFVAAMLAYYIALRTGLPKPFWAIVTVYIVSQTSAGASLSRGVYRFAGTLAGAIATVAIVPNFVNDPLLCSLVLAAWIGLCMFLSLLDRTPRAYACVLAGYTASLIGFPSVLDPGAVFETASVRVQEISIGIVCAALIHRYVLPKSMTGRFTGMLSATLLDARRLAGDALKGKLGESRRDRYRLAEDLLALQGLATHLPYDPAPVTPRRETLQLIHDRLVRLLLLAPEIEDRIHALRTGDGTAPDELTQLVGDAVAWIATVVAEEREVPTAHLIARARSVQKRFGVDAAPLGDRLAANLAGHVAEMIGLLHDCDRLGRSIAANGRLRDAAPLHGARRAKGYVYHRDPWMAGRAALGAMVGILAGCAFWIWSSWPEGGTAVSILGVCCTLFGNFDAPVPFLVKYMVGSLYGAAISFVYSFLIFPQVTDFVVLVAVLAPAFLLAGSLQARPPMTFMALGITLSVPILSGLSTTYTGDFAASLNTVIALFAAVGFGAVSMSFFQTVPAAAAVGRLRRLSRRDVARRALGGAPHEARWMGLMVDRLALLLPRLRQAGTADANVLDEMLRHLRVGHVAGQLRKTIPQIKGEPGVRLRELLSAIAACFSVEGSRAPVGQMDLQALIETGMKTIDGSAVKNRSRIIDLLIDLRFALGSGGTPDGREAPHDR